MNSEILLLHTAVGAPFVGFLCIVLLTFKNSLLSRWISVSLMGLSALVSLILLATHWSLTAPVTWNTPWLTMPHFTLTVGYLLDRLSLLMLFLVSFISFLIQVYSLGYMDHDPGKSRFFAYLSFFSWAMMVFVMAANLLQAYLAWELFGLASYLLIGFWYEKPAAAAAAKKAFVMTRFGDVGFLIGLILILVHGNGGALDYRFLNSSAVTTVFSPAFISTVAFLIFLGMMGKSAQFPLHTWLPDAMEGPTPVSALIHSATMVASGVYLFARLHEFYSFSPRVLGVILLIATITALVGATLASVQRDIKRILAYSTVSQLGLMMMALASGSYLGGVFHLTTHAFFKAMLFMCAGFLIHKFHTNDLYEIAERGGNKEKALLSALTVGCLSLAGLFPLSGFFSKDVILAGLSRYPHPLYYVLASVMSFFTAYYSFKVLFVLYLPKKFQPEDESMPVKSKTAMLIPILLLAGITLTLGLLAVPFSNEFLIRFISYGSPEALQLSIALSSTFVILAGALLAFADVQISPWGGSMAFSVPFLKTILDRKYFLDDLYGWIVRTFVQGLGGMADWFDRNIIDGAVNGVGRLTVSLGRFFSGLQSGALQNYLQAAVWTVAGLIIYLTLLR